VTSLHGPRALRRLAAGAVVLAVVSSLAERPAAAADDAATADGTAISVDELDDTIEAFADQGVLGLSVDPETSTVGADGARTTLTVLIQNVLSAGLLDSLGVEPLADSDRDEKFQSLVASQPQFGELDDHGKQVVTDNLTQFGQLDEITVDDLGDLESRYESSPVSLGVVCAQLFTATDEDAAVAAVNALADGDEFADVESRYGVPDDTVEQATEGTEAVATAGDDTTSGDTTSGDATSGDATAGDATAGGDTSTGDSAPTASSEPADASPFSCTPLRSFATLGADVTAPLLEAPAGAAVVVDTGSAVYVLDVGSYDEVSAPLHNVLSSPPPTSSGTPESLGRMLLDGYMATADVSVNPRYGRWDPLSGSVVALDT
jgi:hypothetical protein